MRRAPGPLTLTVAELDALVVGSCAGPVGIVLSQDQEVPAFFPSEGRAAEVPVVFEETPLATPLDLLTARDEGTTDAAGEFPFSFGLLDLGTLVPGGHAYRAEALRDARLDTTSGSFSVGLV